MSGLPVHSTSFSSSPKPPIVDQNKKKQDVFVRNTRNFKASIWGDQFLTFDEKEDCDVDKQLVEELKEKVRKELIIKASDEPMQHMKLIQLIDAVQRLGIAYHFEDEIEESLHHIFVTYVDMWIHNKNLQSISLWFRLLRQQGFNVSSGIFKNYMDEKGNFKKSICSDAQGMLALYEAAYMRVEGEQILDAAVDFTKTHLANIAKDLSCVPSLRSQIQQALNQPLRKRLPRLEAVSYIPVYEQDRTHNEELLRLAKLDYNMLQTLHKKELSQICRWWKDLDMKNKLPYVRDRLIEGYFWIVGIYFEPQHSALRIFLMKNSTWLIVLDDTYDSYGTYDELEIFTQAIERWSMRCMDVLPEYMKLVYQEFLNIHGEMEKSLEKEGKTYKCHYVKEMTKEYTRTLLKEAKWLKDGYIPTLEEYISKSLVTCAYPQMIACSYVGRGDMVTEDSFRWVAEHPPIVKASSLILRLMNDIVTHKEEQERGHNASSVECYQNEFGASEEEAYEFLSKEVELAWKVINQGSLKPTVVAFPLVTTIINFARVVDTLYKDNDGYTNAGKDVMAYINSIFVHNVLVSD